MRILLASAAVLCAFAQSPPIREASGVVRDGASLLVVDDADVGAYYRVPVPRDHGALLRLNGPATQRVPLKTPGLGIDAESIGFLADGRLALLSERLRSLVSDDGVIAEYDSELAEVAKRGLEGVSIRPLADGASRVAVVWEGGYGDFAGVPARLQRPVNRGPWLPLIVIHDIARNARVGRVKLRDAVATIELDVPVPQGKEPDAQRFRAPDLCWTRLGADWGFIVLLSSQNSVEKPVYQYHWLQRFNMEGKRVGEPIDLGALVPEHLGGANWEGLNWWEPGKSVVLVHESNGRLQPHAFFLDLPKDWQFDERRLR